MKRLLALLALFAVLPAPAARASSPVTRALPSGAKIGSQVGLPGVANGWVVTYALHGWNLGVVDSAPSSSRLVWHQGVSGTPAAISTPGTSGLFRLTSSLGVGNATTVYAFRVAAWHVRSAIAGNASGQIEGDDGASLQPQGFRISTPDEEHVGSVPYRFEIQFRWSRNAYRHQKTIRVPDLPSTSYPTPNGVLTTKHGDLILLKLETATTTDEQERGLMYRTKLDADSGMIFVWDHPVQVGFWMENTLIPLSIAFLGPDGNIQEIQDMQPQTTDIHVPRALYQYAVEVNQGYFKNNGIAVGERFKLTLTSAAPSSIAR